MKCVCTDLYIKLQTELGCLWDLFHKITHLARGPRYRKKPPARAANQIAGNHKITPGVHK